MTETSDNMNSLRCSAKEIFSSSRTFLMGIAMISVVMFHERLLPTFFLTTLFRLFGCWGVDIFLFLSGFGCAYAMRKYTASAFLKTRMLRILPACFVVGLALSMIDTHFMVWELKWGLLYNLLGLNYWYIQAILMFYLLTPLFYSNQKVEGSRIVWTYDIGVSFIAYIQDKYQGLFYKLHDCKDCGLLIGPLCRHS